MSKKKPSIPVVPQTPSPLDTIFPVAMGAFATLVAAGFSGVGSNIPWYQAGTHMGAVLRMLGFTALVGGSAAGGLGGRRLAATPLAAASCALGWIVWGLSDHYRNSGDFLSLLPEKTPLNVAATIFQANLQTYSVMAAMALLLAALAARVTARFFDRATANEVTATAAGLGFRQAFMSPVLIVVTGIIGLMAAGLAALPLGGTKVDALPAVWPAALWCGLWIALAFGAAAFLVRRNFVTPGSAGFLIAPPLALAALSALFVAAHGQLPLVQPGLLLVWHTSPLEGAAWGALGAAIGAQLAKPVSASS